MSSSKNEPILKDQLLTFIKKQLITVLKYAGLYSIALIYWELLLRTQTGFDDFSLYFLLFLPAESLFLATLTGWLKPKFNRWLTPAVMLLPFAFYVSQLIYFRIFGSMFSVSMMGLGADAVGNFGWALWSTVKESIGWIILCLLPVAAAVLLSFLAPKGFYKRFKPISHLGSFILTVVTWFLAVLLLLPFGTGDASPYAAYSSAYVDTDTAADRLGVMTNTLVELRYVIFGAEADADDTLTNPDVQPPVLDTEVDTEPEIDTSPNVLNGVDFNALKESTTDKGKQELCDYFNSVTATNKNAYTGILKDYNLIYICAESFSKYAIDPVVTPTLFRMSCGGIVLNNYYNSFKNTTTNGEFIFMTGLWPDVSRKADSGTTVGSFAQSVNKDIPFALGNMFESNGIKSYAYHNYRGYYYSRNKTHPNLGYTTTRFMGGQNGMTFTSSWPSSDLEMMEQSIDDFINDEQFHTYYMTFSGHGPYSTANPIAVKNIEKVRELLGDRKLTKNAEYYLAANYELELAMEYLFKRLEEAGKLQNTLIVLTGDHYPYYLNDDALESLAGGEVEENFDKFHSSCIMWCGGLPTTKVDTYCSNVDILPTVLNLFGMEYDSRLLPGVDIFSTNTTHMATLYNKSFITEYVRYNSQDGKAEWTAAAAKLSDEQKQQYLDYCIAVTKSKYTVSLKLMEENFYKFVTDSLAVDGQ
ncbi:MAG: sulfatase-like hydrolase/transferase [Clostridia bacterium]|nr:sulfatase-like hydrolase/transferase [Clostridia bacterium]